MLTCVTGRACSTAPTPARPVWDKNLEARHQADDGVTAGLFAAPVLMGCRHHSVQGLRCRRPATRSSTLKWRGMRVNHLYGEHFVLPEA